MKLKNISSQNLKILENIGFVIEIIFFVYAGFFISKKSLLSIILYFLGIGMAILVGQLIKEEGRRENA